MARKKTTTLVDCLTQAESADLVEQMRSRLQPYLAAIDPRLVELMNLCSPGYSTVLRCSAKTAERARSGPAAAYTLLLRASMMSYAMLDGGFDDVVLELNLPDEWVSVKEWMDERKLMAV